MTYSEQERLDKRIRRDYMDVSEGRVGVDARLSWTKRSQFALPDVGSISDHVQEFLQRAGINCEKAIPVGVGAATGPGMESVFRFMKPIGVTIQLVKFFLAWRGRIAARKRRVLLPQVVVTLLAEHIEPRRSGTSEWEDMARLLALILPDVQKNLESQFPSINFHYEFRAEGRKVPNVILRAGDGLLVTDAHVLQMLKRLDREASSLTLLHCEGWFAFPKVVAVNFRVRPIRLPVLSPSP